MGREASNKREWILLPPPGMEDVDEQKLVQEVLQTIGFAQRLGFATTISPIRVKDEDGEFFTGGFVFRSFSVPTLTIAQYGRMMGAEILPEDDENFEFAPPPEDDPDPEPEPELDEAIAAQHFPAGVNGGESQQG